MEGEAQYDSTLGGNQELPAHINLLQFTSARAKEIQDLKLAIQNSNGTKMIFQGLPRHMRRRIMSHNVKRLPRRLREVHLNQMKKSGMPVKRKKPTRKYRRRPHNLLNDYYRRQRNHIWLETHIWHAKRFHMVEKWNYKLADRPCDKAFRACYRATANHCLVQDISYFSCLEISGPMKVLIDRLNVCSNNSGLSVGAKAYINGNREGQKVLFSDNCDDAKTPVGTVYFHWRPIIGNNCNDETLRTMWLWVHSSFYLEIIDLLKNCFDLQKGQNEKQLLYVNRNLNVCLMELKNHLNRFRLTGPLALSVLYNTLKIASLESSNSNWFDNYLSDQKHSDIFAYQCEYWKNMESLSSASELSPHHILSLIVRDPRYHLSKTKTKAVISDHKNLNFIQLPRKAAFGPMWLPDVRNEVKQNKISNENVSKQRSELLIPGSALELPSMAVPVLIIQRPGNETSHLGYSCGWDLIVPSGWGNTFWMSLIMWGGRAGGLREFDHVEFESGNQDFLPPDTNAGRNEEQFITETCEKKFFRLPPNKRPNYTKLGIINPFSFNWNILVQNWNSQSTNDFFILRDKKILCEIQEVLRKDMNADIKNINFKMNCVVPVRISLDKKGIAKRFARVYLPFSKDVTGTCTVTEPLHIDENQCARKNMRNEHKLLLRQLKRKKTKIAQDDAKNYQQIMKELWLPNKVENIRNCGVRQVIGFVTMGGFSYSQVHGCAIGYIAIGAIDALLQNSKKNKILIRNISSRQYRVATLDIIT